MRGLTLANLNYRYTQQEPHQQTSALNQVSLELPGGQVVALIGPNGCGKSTLLKLICGILPFPKAPNSAISPTSSSPYLSPYLSPSISWQGEKLDLLPLRTRVKTVSYLGPELQFDFPLTAYEAVMMGHIPQHPAASWQHSETEHQQVQSALEQVGCWPLRNRFMGELSGGEQQLVGLARILVQATPVVLLDETLSRMDLNHQVKAGTILRKLASEGKLVIVVSHDLNLSSEWSDSVALMCQGKLINYGPIKTTLTESNLKALYPETPLLVVPNPRTGIPKVFTFCKV